MVKDGSDGLKALVGGDCAYDPVRVRKPGTRHRPGAALEHGRAHRPLVAIEQSVMGKKGQPGPGEAFVKGAGRFAIAQESDLHPLPPRSPIS